LDSIFNRKQTFQREVFLLIALLFVLFFFGDLARKSAILAEHDFIRYTGLTKFIGLLLIGLLVVKRKMYNLQYVKKLFFTLVVLWSCFFMGVIALKNVNSLDVIYNDLVYTVRASFIPLILIPFFSLEKKTAETAISVFELLFWINAIFIVIGFVGEIKFLRTYGLTRFGYKGLFDRSSQTSFYFVFVIFYYYYLWFYKKSRKALFLFVIAALLSLLVGTKRLYFVVAIILVFHFFNAKLYKKIYTWIVLVISAAVMSLNWDTITEKLIVTFSVLYKVYKEDGFLSALFSYRNDLLLKFINNFMEDHC